MQQISLKLKGLYTFPNNLGKEVPDGALAVADNIVIDAPGIAQSRRGFDLFQYALPNSGEEFNKIFSYQSKLLAHTTQNKMYWYDSGSGWQAYSGTYNSLGTLHPVRSAEANQNFYFTTTAAVKKLSAYNGNISSAGMFKGLDITAALAVAGSGFFAPDNQIAYRVVWGLKDANNYVPIGAPSQRAVLANPSAGTADDVTITITIPSGVTTSHFYQVYRSPQSGADNVEPSDELQLVYEANPTSGEITAGSLTFTDNTPDSLRGATLYTSPSQEGIAQANEIPPQAKDIAFFSDSVFYANTVSKHRLNLTLLATGGTGGLALNNVITIAGVAYTAKAAENAAAGEFELFTGGTPAQDIADTAQSLIRVINKYASNTTVYAYYLSGVDELPGQILIEERGFGGSSFAATASANGASFSPALPTSGTSVSSSNDVQPNAIYFSKTGLPEAVPLTNIFPVGNKSKAILRIIPLRDSLFVLKEDGIWRIIGNAPSNFRVEGVDTSVKLLAPESAAAINNQIFALTDQGVAIITETGVSIASEAIEGDLLQLFGDDQDAVKQYSFGISYETDRRYILFTVSSTADTRATQAYVYNIFRAAWTRWDLAANCGIVDPSDNKLVIAPTDSETAKKERKSYTFRDYVDECCNVTISSYSGTTLVLSSVADIVVGDLIYQSDSVNSIVESIDTGASSVTVRDELTWSLEDSAIHYSAIETVIEWLPATGGNPGTIKNFQECDIFFKDIGFTSVDIGFKTDYSTAFEYVSVPGRGIGAWGLFEWGNEAWGGVTVQAPVRTYVPLEKARGTELIVRLETRLAFQRFSTLGLSIPFESGNYWVV